MAPARRGRPAPSLFPRPPNTLAPARLVRGGPARGKLLRRPRLSSVGDLILRWPPSMGFGYASPSTTPSPLSHSLMYVVMTRKHRASCSPRSSPTTPATSARPLSTRTTRGTAHTWALSNPQSGRQGEITQNGLGVPPHHILTPQPHHCTSRALLDFVAANRRWMREQATARLLLLPPSASSPVRARARPAVRTAIKRTAPTQRDVLALALTLHTHTHTHILSLYITAERDGAFPRRQDRQRRGGGGVAGGGGRHGAV